MRYVMKQKLLSWGDDFRVKNEAGQDVFFVDGRAFSIGNKLSFQDLNGNELAFIRQKLLSWGPTYEIYRGGQLVAVMKQKLFTFLRYKFTVDETATPQPVELEIAGDFWAHEYQFARNGVPVAMLSKRWFAWADTYGVDVSDAEDPVLILACTVVVDMVSDERKRKD